MSDEAKRPNVVLIMCDQMRKDALGINNPHGIAHTPHLDQLAREGVNFTSAYSACPTCIAARASLFTGLSPANHGITGYHATTVWRYPTTLAGTFAEAGYHTQSVGKMHVQPPRTLVGFHNIVLHEGFLHDKRRNYRNAIEYDDYLPWLRERLGSDADITDATPGCNGYAVRPWPWDERYHPTAYVVTKAIEFLYRRDPQKPFFLKMGFHRPHSPLDPPRTYWDMYEDVKIPEPLEGDWNDSYDAFGHYHHPENPIPRDPISVKRARRAHYALVTQIDYELNRLFIHMGDLNVMENTVFVFLSDHGDMLYDHRMVRKSVPFEGSAGIPFCIRMPAGMREGFRGITNDKPVEIRDVFPTLCDICGIPTPEGLDGENVLSPDFSREYIHGEHPCGRWSNQFLTNGKEKYMWRSDSGRELLFDVSVDPFEKHDIAREKPERTAYWRALLVKELTDRPEGYVEHGSLIIGRQPVAALPWAGIGKAAWEKELKS